MVSIKTQKTVGKTKIKNKIKADRGKKQAIRKTGRTDAETPEDLYLNQQQQ